MTLNLDLYYNKNAYGEYAEFKPDAYRFVQEQIDSLKVATTEEEKKIAKNNLIELFLPYSRQEAYQAAKSMQSSFSLNPKARQDLEDRVVSSASEKLFELIRSLDSEKKIDSFLNLKDAIHKKTAATAKEIFSSITTKKYDGYGEYNEEQLSIRTGNRLVSGHDSRVSRLDIEPLREVLLAQIVQLDAQTSRALILHYGLGSNSTPATFEEIAEEMGIEAKTARTLVEEGREQLKSSPHLEAIQEEFPFAATSEKYRNINTDKRILAPTQMVDRADKRRNRKNLQEPKDSMTR